MKKLILPAILLFLAGCDYDIPLSQTPSAPANPALAGKWSGQPANEKPVRIEIKTSGTDYSVIYTEGGDELTFKGFEIKAAGLNLIQLELKDAEKQKYLFAKYELTPDGLSVYRLNPEVVSAKCQTAEELLNDLAVHRNNPFLFSEPLKFTRSVQQ
ncbi:MAG: hypothetical protein HOO88_06580 [Kiritimatiellaceae bacterium]|nr:hypothetical protein [Kiritimatiellaceae bacterium]